MGLGGVGHGGGVVSRLAKSMKVLISWTGLRREPHAFRAGQLVPGTHLQVLRDSPYSGQFQHHYLLSVPETLEDASQIVREIAALGNGPQTDVKVLQLLDPTDLHEIAGALSIVWREIGLCHPPLSHEFFVLLNTGTPQMQAVWLLLASMGLVAARLIQTCPPELALQSGTPPVRELNTDFSHWRELFTPVKERHSTT